MRRRDERRLVAEQLEAIAQCLLVEEDAKVTQRLPGALRDLATLLNWPDLERAMDRLSYDGY